MIADVIKNYDTKELIEYLKRKNIKFKEIYFKILYKKKITNLTFLELTEKKLKWYGIKGGSITVLVKFIESLSQKLYNYFLYKTLDDLKKILYKNNINRKNITNIKQFLPNNYYINFLRLYIINNNLFFFLSQSLRKLVMMINYTIIA